MTLPRGVSLSPRGRRSRTSKYGNIPTEHMSPVIGLKKFDSKWEAQLCAILDAMTLAGEITTFIDQVSIPLGADTERGRRRMMRVDFMIIDLLGRAHFWDAKAVPSAKWTLQQDIAWAKHKIDVHPVKKGKPLPIIYEEGEHPND